MAQEEEARRRAQAEAAAARARQLSEERKERERVARENAARAPPAGLIIDPEGRDFLVPNDSLRARFKAMIVDFKKYTEWFEAKSKEL